MKIKGRVWRFGDNINTDLIFPSRFFKPRYAPGELAAHILSGIDPEFSTKVRPGDIIVAGSNFGCGSSREEAAACIREAGIGAVVASSFGRLFMRNCINLGVPAVVCPAIHEHVADGDQLEVDLAEGKIRNLATGYEATIPPFAPEILRLLAEGGLVEFTRRRLAAGRPGLESD